MTADTTTQGASLAPCPFCDTPARQSQGGEGAAAWFGTGCGGSQSCPAYLRGLVHKSQAAADAAWNRRAQVPAVEAKAARWDWLCRHWSTLNVKFNKDGITLKGLTLTVNANAQGAAGSPRLDSIADQGIAEEADQGITGAPNGKPK